MPVWYYTGPSSTNQLPRKGQVPLLEASWAERSLYDYEEKQGYAPIDPMGFNNRVNYEPPSYLEVELSDQLIEWFIRQYPITNQDTERLLAGQDEKNGVLTEGITLRVKTTNNEQNRGADITFSQSDDVIGVGTPTTLPTFYAFLTTLRFPDQNELIRAGTGPDKLNNHTINVLPVTDDQPIIHYIWSAVDVKKDTVKQQYRNNFFITVQNIDPTP